MFCGSVLDRVVNISLLYCCWVKYYDLTWFVPDCACRVLLASSAQKVCARRRFPLLRLAQFGRCAMADAGDVCPNLMQRLWGSVVEAEHDGVEEQVVGQWGELLTREVERVAETMAAGAEDEVMGRLWGELAEKDLDSFLAEEAEAEAHAKRQAEAVAWRKEEERLGRDRALARRATAARREERRVAMEFEREQQEAERKASVERAARRRARDVKRATELLATEKQLVAARARRAQATTAVAQAEDAAKVVLSEPCFGRDEKALVQQHLFVARGAEAAAGVALQAAREAATLGRSGGWAASSASRQLAALRTLAGATLPRELHDSARATRRARCWQEAEGAEAKRAREKREEGARRATAQAVLRRERRRMTAEGAHSNLLNYGIRKTRLIRGVPGWRQTDARRAQRRLGEAWAARRAAERKQSRLKLEARAAAEREARRAERNGVGTGAGRRAEGPAEMELRALLRRETAVPKTKAVPKRLAPRGEVRDGLAGTWTWWDSRAPNELGLVQSFLPDDEVAETVERAAEEGSPVGANDEWEDMLWHASDGGAAGERYAGVVHEPLGDYRDGPLVESGARGVLAGSTSEDVWEGAHAMMCTWAEEGEDAWADGDNVAATEVTEPRGACDGCGGDALLEDALERARQTALEMGERDVGEW